VFLTSRHHRSLFRSLGVALYATVVIVASFEHHDLICHIKNPQHCTACTASQLGTDPGTLATASAWQLSDAGSTVSFLLCSDGVLLPHQSTGRSPPASL
jgi:hypothetical protein